MKREQLWRVGFLLTALVSGCASFGMGKACPSSPDLPPRPDRRICIANGSGGGGCFDPRENPSEFPIDSILNNVCLNPDDNKSQEEWIKFVIDSCKGR